MKRTPIVLTAAVLLAGTFAWGAEIDCKVDVVGIMGSRVHVHCAGAEPISWFALPLNSPAAVSFQLMAQQVFAESLRNDQVLQLTEFCAPSSTTGVFIGCKGGAQGISGKIIVPSGGSTYRPLHIEYDLNDKSGAAFGCQAGDCRKPLAFSIRR